MIAPEEYSQDDPLGVDLDSPQLLEGLLARLPKAFACLYRQSLAPVYRYHLARSSDVIEAQDRTAETFRAVLERIDAYRSKSGSLLAWVLGIARHKQMDALRHPVRPYPPDLAGQEIPEEGQAERNLQAIQVARALRKLSPEKADALALRFFAGLSLPEASRVAGKPMGHLEKLVQAGLKDLNAQVEEFPLSEEAALGSLAERLKALAVEIHPDPAFAAALKGALTGQLSLPRARKPTWQIGLEEQRYRLRSILSPRMLTGLTIAILLVAGLFASLSFIPQTPPAPPTPTSTADESILYAPNPAGGYLVPPPLSVCRDWQARLSARLGMPVELDANAPIQNPPTYGNDSTGTACELMASGDGNAFVSTQNVVDRVTSVIETQGVTSISRYGANPYIQGSAQNRDWFSLGIHFFGQNLNAFLLVGWQPAAGAGGLCTPGMTEAQCQVAPGDQLFHLSLMLGADNYRSVVADFIQRWEQGQNSATTLFSTHLLASLPDARALDRLAELDRKQVPNPGISWQVIENKGDAVRVELTLWDGPPASADSRRFTTLQMVLAPERGVWLIQDLIHGVFFNPSNDTLLLADEHGQIYEMDLNTRNRINLSQRGVFSPDPGPDPASLAAPQAWLSPDALQLVVSSSRGGWLISLQLHNAKKITGPLALVAWAPNGQSLLYIERDAPDVVQAYSLSTGLGRELARFQQPVLDVAWSPRGDRAAVAEQIDAPAIMAHFKVWRVNAADGQTGLLYPDGNALYDPKTPMLAWTVDQSEVWLLGMQLAIRLQDGSPHLLVAQPVSQDQAQLKLIQDGLLGMMQDWSGQQAIARISPDQLHVARAELTSNGDFDFLGVMDIHELNSYAWSHSVLGTQTMDYTPDGNSLILSGGINRLGSIWRLNASSGDGQRIVDQAAFLGLLSQLQKASLRLAPTVKKTNLPNPPVGEPWTTYSLSSSALWSVAYPAGWSLTARPDRMQGQVTLSNMQFSSDYGWSSLGENDLMIEITLVNQANDEAVKQRMAQIQSDPSAVWEKLMVAGRTAYRHQGLVGETLIPLENNLVLVVDQYPSSSKQDAVFERILQSITIGNK